MKQSDPCPQALSPVSPPSMGPHSFRALMPPGTVCPVGASSGYEGQPSPQSVGFGGGRRKSRPDRIPCGTLWPHGEFSLGYAAKELADNSGIISKAGFGGDVESLRRCIERFESEGEGGPLGSSLGSNSHTPAQRPETYGRKGITGYGKKMVRAAATLLQRRVKRHSLTFLTLTVPELSRNAMEAIALAWNELLRQLIQYLRRRLERKGLFPEIVSVTELQPRRLKDGSLGCLHLHIAFQGRASRAKAWWLTPLEIREWWLKALSRVAGQKVESSAVENLKMVRSSAAGYLGKYMSKGAGDVEKYAAIAGWECVPRQWWNLSAAMRRRVKAATFKGDRCGAVLDEMIYSYFESQFRKFPGVLFCYQVDAGGGPVTIGYYGRLDSENRRCIAKLLSDGDPRYNPA